VVKQLMFFFSVLFFELSAFFVVFYNTHTHTHIPARYHKCMFALHKFGATKSGIFTQCEGERVICRERWTDALEGIHYQVRWYNLEVRNPLVRT